MTQPKPDAPGTKAFEGNETQAESRATDGFDVDADAAPDDVGESTTRRGEDIEDRDSKEDGRYDTGTQGPSDRPTGTSTPDSATGVGDSDPIQDDMPNMPPGR